MNTIVTLIMAATLGAGAQGVLVPLTPIEATNLGLSAEADGVMFRSADNASGFDMIEKSIDGSALSLTLSAREQRTASNASFLSETDDGRWCQVGSSNAFADIAVNLPEDAVVTGMRLWGYDTSVSNDLTVSLIERCTPNSQSGGVITSVVAALTPDIVAGNFTKVTTIGANNTIDNDACSYTLRTRYSTPGEANACAGSSLRLQKIRLVYSLP